MRLSVDPQADALYLRLNEGEIADSEQVAPDVVLDYDADDNVVGVELLQLSKRVPQADLQRVLVETLHRPAESLVQEVPPQYGPESM